MSRSYFTQDQKLTTLVEVKPWSFDDCYEMMDILHEKGYSVNCVSRVACDKQWHDAWSIEREDAPKLVEQLFRQRLVAEFEANGKHRASIIFGHNYPAETIIRAVKKFQKKQEGLNESCSFIKQ